VICVSKLERSYWPGRMPSYVSLEKIVSVNILKSFLVIALLRAQKEASCVDNLF
jgi:hypothetical protein